MLAVLSCISVSLALIILTIKFNLGHSQIQEIFSAVGPVKRIIMGLNMKTKTPCGFCFVEYYTREHMEACLKFVSNTVCDGMTIRCDLDAGFKPGRQYGRGISGGQVRDERRQSRGDNTRGGGQNHYQSNSSGGKRGRDRGGGDRREEKRQNEPGKDDFGRDIVSRLDQGLSSKRSAPVEVDEKEQAEKEQAAAEEHVGRERSEDDTEESNKRVRKTSEEEEA